MQRCTVYLVEGLVADVFLHGALLAVLSNNKWCRVVDSTELERYRIRICGNDSYKPPGVP